MANDISYTVEKIRVGKVLKFFCFVVIFLANSNSFGFSTSDLTVDFNYDDYIEEDFLNTEWSNFEYSPTVYIQEGGGDYFTGTLAWTPLRIDLGRYLNIFSKGSLTPLKNKGEEFLALGIEILAHLRISPPMSPARFFLEASYGVEKWEGNNVKSPVGIGVSTTLFCKAIPYLENWGGEVRQMSEEGKSITSYGFNLRFSL